VGLAAAGPQPYQRASIINHLAGPYTVVSDQRSASPSDGRICT